MGKNIAIIDIESNGASTSYANIISIAGILVNPELEELDHFEFWCRNKPGHVPDPYSMWVNRGFSRMKNSNLSHYSMMTELHKYINTWSPCIWAGWNSIGFDFVMLQKENYKSLFPIYATKHAKPDSISQICPHSIGPRRRRSSGVTKCQKLRKTQRVFFCRSETISR